jgi:serine/threonine protein kinase
VLVRADVSATIVDFGIARPHDGTELTDHGSVLGTASYVAPELLTASGVVVSPASSLGELVARGTPPPAPRLRDAVDVPHALDEAVARCLEVDPADRPSSAREVGHLLAASERPTAAYQTLVLPPQPRPQPLRHVSWSRPRALLAAIVLVALVVSVAWLAWPEAGPRGRPPDNPRPRATKLASSPVGWSSIHRPSSGFRASATAASYSGPS